MVILTFRLRDNLALYLTIYDVVIVVSQITHFQIVSGKRVKKYGCHLADVLVVKIHSPLLLSFGVINS